MTLLGYAILPLILVGAQVAMTRRYGWWGLAWGTGAGIIVIFGGGAIVKEMTLLDYAIVLSLILVGAQAAMTRRYGWWGLAWGTGAGIIVIFGGGLIVQAWKPDEFGFFWLSVLYAFFIVLIAAILLAFTVKTE